MINSFFSSTKKIYQALLNNKVKGCESFKYASFKSRKSNTKLQGLCLNDMKNGDVRFEYLIGIDAMSQAEYGGFK